jgi:hypothetical protein
MPAKSSVSAARMTIFNLSSGSGLCSAFASSHGARVQPSRSSSVVRITVIAFAAFASACNACSCGVLPKALLSLSLNRKVHAPSQNF